MKTSVADVLAALAVPGMAALGGAGAVYAGYDDAPGGVLIGFVLVLGAAALSLRVSLRSRS